MILIRYLANYMILGKNFIFIIFLAVQIVATDVAQNNRKPIRINLKTTIQVTQTEYNYVLL